VKEFLINKTQFGLVFESLRIFNLFLRILCFVDRASRHTCAIQTNLMHYLSSVYFVNQPLHVSGIFMAHHQEVYYIYMTTGTCCAYQLNVCWPGWDGTSIPTRPTDSQLKSTTLTNCCVCVCVCIYIYTVYLLMMVYKYTRNIQRLTN
jgi:hypothetical protein